MLPTASSTGSSSIPSAAAVDPAAMLNTKINNALASAVGDSQYWEESISPSTIRTSLSQSDPSNPNSTATILRGMKWLLASISKGRNVSDFYPHVVKLVGAPSLEARKMVYMYLIQYANHDATTRELSLLSINSFQRGLADQEQLIRALALRVLTSIQVPDILQIQIMGVQKCAKDASPYVRKCAANASMKLYSHDEETMQNILQTILEQEKSTMVLSSAMVAFSNICPHRLEMVHSCYRKLCHFLTDMDEWGQVIIIDTLARYCRTYFCKPRGIASAEAIDAERRVRRTTNGISSGSQQQQRRPLDDDAQETTTMNASSSPTIQQQQQLPKRIGGPRKIKRRVVKKGFYSDEEDESTEEEVFATNSGSTTAAILSAPTNGDDMPSTRNNNNVLDDFEDDDLHPDHRLLLRSCLPLLKSRNSGVVLAVCSLHYYCGVASIKMRSSLGKALVRIHRDRREIQYAVLSSIRTLVTECPSAFTPFLQDFFVKATDPSFSRMLKLDILTLLALEPPSIASVMKELRTYIRHDDKVFVCAAVRAVGKVVELARIVHDRHGQKSGHVQRERTEANKVALNALYGLLTLSAAGACNANVVGESTIVMQRITLLLWSDNNNNNNNNNSSMSVVVEDPNNVQDLVIKRLLQLLIHSLSSRSLGEDDAQLHSDDDDGTEEDDAMQKSMVKIPPAATAASLWILGEWLTPYSSQDVKRPVLDDTTKRSARAELVRLVSRAFSVMDAQEKVQSIHFASKVLISLYEESSSPISEACMCELILSMGRVDVNTDVRDRARFESGLLHTSIGLKWDSETLSPNMSRAVLDVGSVKKMLLQNKPPSSFLPVESEEIELDNNESPFRFGTLSSLMNRCDAYLPLPPWADTDSASSLREPPVIKGAASDNGGGWNKVDTIVKKKPTTTSGFYDSDDDDDESTENDEDSDDESSWDDESDDDDDDDDDESDDNDDDESDDSDDTDDNVVSLIPGVSVPVASTELLPDMLSPAPTMNGTTSLLPLAKSTSLIDHENDDDDGDSNDESDDWDSDDSDDSDDESDGPSATSKTLLDMPEASPVPLLTVETVSKPASNGNSATYAQGMEGLVMAPVQVEASEEKPNPDLEKDSSEWFDWVKSELGGGLSVQARYLRGPTRDREAQLAGMDPSSPAVVVWQVKMENKRTDTGTLRRIRMIQRSTTAGHIAAKRWAIPPEVQALAKGKAVLCTLAIEFSGVSDREGNLQARMDLKSDRGSTSLDIRPPLTELVRPIKMTVEDFDQNMSRLQGFQRVSTTFVGGKKKDALTKRLLKHLALIPLKCSSSDETKLVGTLPASTDKLYVTVTFDDFGSGNLTLCCDNAIAINSVLDCLKKALK